MEHPPIVYDGVEFIYRFMAVDVQADHFWCLVEIWSAKGDSLTLWFGQLYTWPEIEAAQAQWGVLDQNVQVDVRHRRQEVLEQCILHGHAHGREWRCWKAYQGSHQKEFKWTCRLGANKGKVFLLPYTREPPTVAPYAHLPANDPRRARLKGRKCPLVTWSNPTIKDVVMNRRDGRTRGCLNLVARDHGSADSAWNKEYNKHLHGEQKTFVQGEYRGEWKYVFRWRNHGLDCKCMITARAYQVGLLGAGGEE